jgi:hypothetical protein
MTRASMCCAALVILAVLVDFSRLCKAGIRQGKTRFHLRYQAKSFSHQMSLLFHVLVSIVSEFLKEVALGWVSHLPLSSPR